jgi:hypothetical protein
LLSDDGPTYYFHSTAFFNNKKHNKTHPVSSPQPDEPISQLLNRSSPISEEAAGGGRLWAEFVNLNWRSWDK